MVATKNTHFGRAGEYFAMSELLLRGWNVAVPVVDVGDDVFVIDDHDKTTFRVQAKSAHGELDERTGRIKARFTLQRSQLRDARAIELFYVLMVRLGAGWRYFVVSRESLSTIRANYSRDERIGRGRPPVTDELARSDGLVLELVIDGGEATAWNRSFTEFLEQWPAELGLLEHGPGSRTPTTSA